ncbi:pectinesterase [Trifolium repens]|nr:Pectin lyase superfamily protein [Trifolium repens]WJX10386.1 pectinesterase [Trifolium repens]
MVGLEVELSNAQIYKRHGNRLLPYKTIIVDPKRNGNFSTIQSAINSIPSNNRYWTSINIKAGIYREKLKIPHDKPYIIIQGEGMKKTIVEWDDHANTAQSPTFFSMADHIVVKFITFRNTYNDPKNGNPMVPAVAAMISGDKSYFYSVAFLGLQDTLWDDEGRHYYKNCLIQGAADFIFGAGQSLYEECSIYVIGAALGPGICGFITAQGRTNPNDANGFVFKNCNVFGDGTTYLGRPWRAYARVLFYNTNMSKIVLPLGWDPWHLVGHEDHIQFSEYKNYGPGSNTNNRVKWMKKLDLRTVTRMASIGFIDDEGWVKNQLF